MVIRSMDYVSLVQKINLQKKSSTVEEESSLGFQCVCLPSTSFWPSVNYLYKTNYIESIPLFDWNMSQLELLIIDFTSIKIRVLYQQHAQHLALGWIFVKNIFHYYTCTSFQNLFATSVEKSTCAHTLIIRPALSSSWVK